MLQTLFHIPDSIAGLPVFGFGLLFWLWLIASIVVVAYLVKTQGWTTETQSYLPVLLVIGGVVTFVLPALMEDGGVPIRGYGVMLLLAVVSGVGLSIHRARRMGVNPDLIYSLAFWMFISGMLGARLFYVIEYWDQQFKHDSLRETLAAMVNVAQGGLVVYGSLIGGLIAFAVFVRRHRVPGLALADLIAPGMALGLCLGRVGCLLNGCCYGGICEPPDFGHQWAVTFPWGSPPYQHQNQRLHGMTFGFDHLDSVIITDVVEGSPADLAGIKANDTIQSVRRPADNKGGPVGPKTKARDLIRQLTEPGATLEIVVNDDASPKTMTLADPLPRSRPVHPTQIYSSINAALICLLMLAVYPYRRRDGQVIALMLTIYPITRFLLEIIRKDESAVFGSGMSISQNVSVVLIAGIVGLWIYVLRSRKPLAFPPV